VQVIYDDGNIPDLSALATIRSVSGPLIIYGNYNASLKDLTGLEGIKVSVATKLISSLPTYSLVEPELRPALCT
jgi:hypothetical protein